MDFLDHLHLVHDEQDHILPRYWLLQIQHRREEDLLSLRHLLQDELPDYVFSNLVQT